MHFFYASMDGYQFDYYITNVTPAYLFIMFLGVLNLE